MLNTNYINSDARTIHLYDQTYSQQYRQADDVYVRSADFIHFSNILTELTTNFNRPIKVLEVGCGTGRYFHALKNTAELTGIDISGPMLKMAEEPLRSDEVNIPLITLIEDSIFDHDFTDERFDLIYSIGVLGEHAPFTKALCDKLFGLLNDDGTFFFTAIDLGVHKNFRRMVAETAYHLLPGKMKHVLDRRWTTNYMTHDELDEMMSASMFDDYNITSYKKEGTGWRDAHLECLANKYDLITRAFFL